MSGERVPEIVPISSANKPTQVEIVGDRIRIASLEVVDRALAGFLESRSPEDRAETVERAMRVGLMALQSASGSIDVDHVRRAFDKLLTDAGESNKKATAEVEEILRKTFANEGGALPATLERFLGDKGELALFTKDLFDENRRDSALGKLNTILGTYFDGDASKLAHLLDPTREASPLSGFRAEIAKRFDDVLLKIVELDASQKAAKGERKKGTAKGADFESRVIAEYTELLRATNDEIEGTGGVAGSIPDSKKGDAVITINGREKDALATIQEITGVGAYGVGARADIVIEASGVPSLLADAISMTRAGGKLRIAALYEGNVPIDANQIVQKEMSVAGTFAYRGEFSQVLQMLSDGRVTAEPLITHTFSLDQITEAFTAQLSKDSSIKVQIAP